MKRQRAKAVIYAKRSIALFLVITFLASSTDLALAQEALGSHKTSTLSPASRLDPLTETSEEKALLAGAFRQNAEFLYVQKMLCRAVRLQLTDADELIAWIEDDLKGETFSIFDYRRIIRSGDGFCIPFMDKDGRVEYRATYSRLTDAEPDPYAIPLRFSDGKNVSLVIAPALAFVNKPEKSVPQPPASRSQRLSVLDSGHSARKGSASLPIHSGSRRKNHPKQASAMNGLWEVLVRLFQARPAIFADAANQPDNDADIDRDYILMCDRAAHLSIVGRDLAEAEATLDDARFSLDDAQDKKSLADLAGHIIDNYVSLSAAYRLAYDLEASRKILDEKAYALFVEYRPFLDPSRDTVRNLVRGYALLAAACIDCKRPSREPLVADSILERVEEFFHDPAYHVCLREEARWFVMNNRNLAHVFIGRDTSAKDTDRASRALARAHTILRDEQYRDGARREAGKLVQAYAIVAIVMMRQATSLSGLEDAGRELEAALAIATDPSFRSSEKMDSGLAAALSRYGQVATLLAKRGAVGRAAAMLGDIAQVMLEPGSAPALRSQAGFLLSCFTTVVFTCTDESADSRYPDLARDIMMEALTVFDAPLHRSELADQAEWVISACLRLAYTYGNRYTDHFDAATAEWFLDKALAVYNAYEGDHGTAKEAPYIINNYMRAYTGHEELLQVAEKFESICANGNEESVPLAILTLLYYRLGEPEKAHDTLVRFSRSFGPTYDDSMFRNRFIATASAVSALCATHDRLGLDLADSWNRRVRGVYTAITDKVYSERAHLYAAKEGSGLPVTAAPEDPAIPEPAQKLGPFEEGSLSADTEADSVAAQEVLDAEPVPPLVEGPVIVEDTAEPVRDEQIQPELVIEQGASARRLMAERTRARLLMAGTIVVVTGVVALAYYGGVAAREFFGYGQDVGSSTGVREAFSIDTVYAQVLIFMHTMWDTLWAPGAVAAGVTALYARYRSGPAKQYSPPARRPRNQKELRAAKRARLAAREKSRRDFLKQMTAYAVGGSAAGALAGLGVKAVSGSVGVALEEAVVRRWLAKALSDNAFEDVCSGWIAASPGLLDGAQLVEGIDEFARMVRSADIVVDDFTKVRNATVSVDYLLQKLLVNRVSFGALPNMLEGAIVREAAYAYLYKHKTCGDVEALNADLDRAIRPYVRMKHWVPLPGEDDADTLRRMVDTGGWDPSVMKTSRGADAARVFLQARWRQAVAAFYAEMQYYSAHAEKAGRTSLTEDLLDRVMPAARNMTRDELRLGFEKRARRDTEFVNGFETEIRLEWILSGAYSPDGVTQEFEDAVLRVLLYDTGENRFCLALIALARAEFDETFDLHSMERLSDDRSLRDRFSAWARKKILHPDGEDRVSVNKDAPAALAGGVIVSGADDNSEGAAEARMAKFKKLLRDFVDRAANGVFGFDIETHLFEVVRLTDCSFAERSIVYGEIAADAAKDPTYAISSWVALVYVMTADAAYDFKGRASAFRAAIGDAYEKRVGSAYYESPLYRLIQAHEMTKVLNSAQVQALMQYHYEGIRRGMDVVQYREGIEFLDGLLHIAANDSMVYAIVLDAFASKDEVDKFFTIDWKNIGGGAYKQARDSLRREYFDDRFIAIFHGHEEEMERIHGTLRAATKVMDAAFGAMQDDFADTLGSLPLADMKRRAGPARLEAVRAWLADASCPFSRRAQAYAGLVQRLGAGVIDDASREIWSFVMLQDAVQYAARALENFDGSVMQKYDVLAVQGAAGARSDLGRLLDSHPVRQELEEAARLINELILTEGRSGRAQFQGRARLIRQLRSSSEDLAEERALLQYFSSPQGMKLFEGKAWRKLQKKLEARAKHELHGTHSFFVGEVYKSFDDLRERMQSVKVAIDAALVLLEGIQKESDPDPDSPGSALSFVDQEAQRSEKFINVMKIRGCQAREKGESIIVALESGGWVPGEQAGAIQPLLSEFDVDRLTREFAKAGLDNVVFVRGDADGLAAKITLMMKEKNAKAGNVIVLATHDTVAGLSAQAELQGDAENPGAFFAEMDTTNITGWQYIRLVEMLTIAAKLAFGDTIDQQAHPQILIDPITKRLIRLIPQIERLDPELLKAIYEKQAEILRSA